MKAQTVTILFTDLVGSTDLLQRAGDEQAQRIFKAHHRILREAVKEHGGHEVKWLGDGLMVVFDSASDAVKCAIAMQQASRRPTAGERLEIRAGINVGEAFVDESDYFGTAVVIARRLCDSGAAGAIRASDIVVRLLDGRGDGLQTKDLGALVLNGIANPVPAVEIVYDHDPMALLRRLPFVGRSDEYEKLLAKLADARNGRGAIVMLAGEPGIGKTRLTEEFCEHAASGATVVRGNCYEGDVAAPFGPWIEALRSLIDQTASAELRNTLGPGAPDIAALLPEIRLRLRDLEESPRLEPEAERARLFDSIVAWLRNVTVNKPLVIFLDDLHWSDRPSLALLEQIARSIAGQRTMIVGTYRDVEVDRVHPLAQALAALRRMEHHERIAVRGFTLESVFDLLTAIEPSEATAAGRHALAQVLHEESEGNPFFIREVLNNLVESGKLVQRDGMWVGAVASIEEMGIPEGIKEVVGRRLSRLGEPCNRMLQRASAMPGGFTWDELRAICDDDEDDLLDALDAALAAQIIVERERNHYTFTHALIRATLYEELSTPRRVQLHRRVAESLESLYAESIDDHLGELAEHYLASSGNAAEKAVEYSVRAGDRAREQFAWEEAAIHYRRALDALSISPHADDERRCRLMLSLARCPSIPLAERIGITADAVELARRLDNPALFAETAIATEQMEGQVEDDRAGARVALLNEALRVIGTGETPLRARLLSHRVHAAMSAASARETPRIAGFQVFAGRKDPQLLADAREAVALAERVGDEEAYFYSNNLLLNYGWTPDNLAERINLAGSAYASNVRAGRADFAIGSLNNRCMALLEAGDIQAFRQTLDLLRTHVQRARLDSVVFMHLAMEVCLEAAEGKLSLAEQHWQAYTAKYSGTADAAATSYGQLAYLRLLQGRADLVPVLTALVERFPAIPIYAAALTSTLATAGEYAESLSIIDRLTSHGLDGIPFDFLWKSTLVLLARASIETGHRAPAQMLYDALRPYASGNATIAQVISYGCIAHFTGGLAALLGRFDEAEHDLDVALRANEKMGFHASAAATRVYYGDMLLRRNNIGDRERAIALLQRAHEFAKECGMGKVERDSARLLATART